MTKVEALARLSEMETILEQTPPGSNHEAEERVREACRDLKMAIPYNSACADVVNWAAIYFSYNKWERYGEAKVREFVSKALARVRQKTEGYYKDLE